MMQHRIRAALACLLCLCFLVPSALVGCQSKPAADHNEVVSVIPDKKGSIAVKAVLTNGFLDSYTEKKVYLFEIPSAYAADVDLAELDPVAEVKPKGEITFKIPTYDGVRSRLYSSFLVASYDSAANSYTALTFPKSVTDLSELAEASGEAVDKSIKGLISDHPADAIRLGIAHTVVDVPMERLILDGWQEGAVSYIWNGVTAYLDGDELERLDETVDAYASAGVHVYLRFLLGAPADGLHTPLALYFLADASVNDAEYCAVNMTDPTAAELMEGFFDFMADRYASPADGSSPVTSFVLGYRVNHGSVYNYAGGLSRDAYIMNYEKLVRVANTAIKSHTADGRVYISLDSQRTAPSEEGHWDVPAFLSAFNNECSMGGNFDWYLSCELYADTSSVWISDADRDTACYTVHSLGTLTDLLAGDIYLTPDGAQRMLLISGASIPAVAAGGTSSYESELCQAASYAYTYMTCVQNGHVEALVYDTYADPDVTADTQSLCGIWKTAETDGILVISEKRPLYDMFKKIDTTEAPSLSGGLSAIIGDPFTKLERILAGGAQPVTAVGGTATLKNFEATHTKASPLYTFDRGTLHGFAGAGDLTYLELTPAETLDSIALYARFDRTAVCDPMGITVNVPAAELIGATELIFDLYAGHLSDPGAVSSSVTLARPTVTLRLTRPAAGLLSEGEDEIIYEASVSEVRDGVWQTAVFDVEAFTSLLELSDEVTLTLLMDHDTSAIEGDVYAANHMGLAGVYIVGNTAASRSSAGLVIGIVAVLVVIVAGVFGYLFMRHKKKYSGRS